MVRLYKHWKRDVCSEARDYRPPFCVVKVPVQCRVGLRRFWVFLQKLQVTHRHTVQYKQAPN